MTLSIEIAKAVRRLRDEGLNQERIAAVLSVSIGYVNKCLNPTELPDNPSLREMIDHAEKICEKRTKAIKAGTYDGTW